MTVSTEAVCVALKDVTEDVPRFISYYVLRSRKTSGRSKLLSFSTKGFVISGLVVSHACPCPLHFTTGCHHERSRAKAIHRAQHLSSVNHPQWHPPLSRHTTTLVVPEGGGASKKAVKLFDRTRCCANCAQFVGKFKLKIPHTAL